MLRGMTPSETKLVAARRQRLSAWIETRFGGSRKAFLEDAAARGHKIDGTEVSNLRSGKKSFGEKKAAMLEEQAAMPKGYLVEALRPETGLDGVPAPEASQASRQPPEVDARIRAVEAVLGAVTAVMVRHRPAEAADLAETLATLPAALRDSALATALREELAAPLPRRKVR
jgi:hypothetical protein